MNFDTGGAFDMLQNLSHMIDVERAECAVRAFPPTGGAALKFLRV